jgi:hypothetical protein
MADFSMLSVTGMGYSPLRQARQYFCFPRGTRRAANRPSMVWYPSESAPICRAISGMELAEAIS